MKQARRLQDFRVQPGGRSIAPQDLRLLAERYVVKPLNAAPNSRLAERVIRCMELLRLARQLNRDLNRAVSRHHAQARNRNALRSTPKELQQMGMDLHNAVNLLNEFMARYRWRVEFRPPGIAGEHAISRADVLIARNKQEAMEGSALVIVSHFQDSVERVRRCGECDRWFFAVTNHQNYCSEGCRQKHAAHSEEFKASRREYMRDYRVKQKAMDLAAERGARSLLRSNDGKS